MVSPPVIAAENVTLTEPDPVTSNMLLSEERPVDVSKPATLPGIDPYAPLKPLKASADASPAPVL